MRCEYQEVDPKGGFLPPSCPEPGDRRALDANGPHSSAASVGYYCGAHALKVIERAEPAHIVDCPSCGCKIGIDPAASRRGGKR